MPDEQEILGTEVPPVADGQAVVDAVAQDTQYYAMEASDLTVERITEVLREQSERETGSAVVLDAEQWDALTSHLRFAATSSLCCTFATMAVFGAVCAGHLVKGWRRG